MCVGAPGPCVFVLHGDMDPLAEHEEALHVEQDMDEEFIFRGREDAYREWRFRMKMLLAQFRLDHTLTGKGTPADQKSAFIILALHTTGAPNMVFSGLDQEGNYSAHEAITQLDEEYAPRSLQCESERPSSPGNERTR